MLFSILKKIFSGKHTEKPEQFPGSRVYVLTIEGEERIQSLLTKKLARHGITVVSNKENANYNFSFWTRDVNAGTPMRWGVRLILRSLKPPSDNNRIGDVDVGDQITNRQFFSDQDFASFAAEWIVDRLKQST